MRTSEKRTSKSRGGSQHDYKEEEIISGSLWDSFEKILKHQKKLDFVRLHDCGMGLFAYKSDLYDRKCWEETRRKETDVKTHYVSRSAAHGPKHCFIPVLQRSKSAQI